MKKSGKLASHVLISNFFADSPNITGGIIRFLSRRLNRFMMDSRFFPFSRYRRRLQHCCFSKVFYVRTVSQLDIDAVFEND
jgi:hypothetical protein